MKRLLSYTLALTFLLFSTCISFAQEAEVPSTPERGSLVEDRAARKLLEAGDARFDSDETTKAIEIWQSVIERFPRSRVRYAAHMRLGNYLLERERAYDRARTHFEPVASEENRDEEDRAEATLKMGICFYEARNFGKSFKIMRDVIEQFPVSPQVNQAYYYIGLGHFQLGHYSRAIDALEKVGTALTAEEGKAEKVEAGKRLFIKIEDADLAALEPGKTIKVLCKSTQGDEETVECHAVGRNVRIVLGSVLTTLGKPQKQNGLLEVKGDDQVIVSYTDSHTSDRKSDQDVIKEIAVVGNGIVEVTDGAFQESLRGVILDRGVNIQVTDADRDLTDAADQIEVVVEVLREKTQEELDNEALEAATATTVQNPEDIPLDGDEPPPVNRYKVVDQIQIVLTEAVIAKRFVGTAEENAEEGGAPADSSAVEIDDSVHSGVFRVIAPLSRSEEIIPDDDVLQAQSNDLVRVSYVDEINRTEEPRDLSIKVTCLDGNIGGVRVTRAQISDQELRIKTQLKTADALTNIGNRYKEFGLHQNGTAKYEQALMVCEEISEEARRLGGRLLEETYVQLWHIYYAMDRLELAAAMSQRLQREFPNSEFVDDALLQLADVSRKKGELQRAIGIYSRLVAMPQSQLRGEAQFGIAECYEQMAEASTGVGSAQLMDRAFQEYKKVFDSYPESGRVGEAVAKMAEYYYRQKDYSRAVDTFETVLGDHPDAKFLDVILFNYGRCLYRMERRAEARRQFDQLISEYPESPLATDAKRISEALAKAGF